MYRLAFFIIATCFLSCSDKQQAPIQSVLSNDTTLKIITTGIPDLESINQLNFLAKGYGFKYYQIGCVVTNSRMDSIQKLNSSTYKFLEKRFGKNWKMNFFSQLDTINQIRQQADSIINFRTPQMDRYFYYLVMPNPAIKSYQVKVYSTDSFGNQSELIVHYKMTITFKHNSSANISNTLEKL